MTQSNGNLKASDIKACDQTLTEAIKTFDELVATY
jgi:hypothetical protein